MTSPTHAALKSMREWMALFIHATKLDPAKTSITFRGPGRHMPLNVKLQEILEIADKALFAEEYPLIELTGPDEPKPVSEPEPTTPPAPPNIRLIGYIPPEVLRDLDAGQSGVYRMVSGKRLQFGVAYIPVYVGVDHA